MLSAFVPGPLILRVFHPGSCETKHCLQAHQLKQVSGMKEEPAGLRVGSTAVLDITGLTSNADKGLFVAGTVSLGFGFEAM